MAGRLRLEMVKWGEEWGDGRVGGVDYKMGRRHDLSDRVAWESHLQVRVKGETEMGGGGWGRASELAFLMEPNDVIAVRGPPPDAGLPSGRGGAHFDHMGAGTGCQCPLGTGASVLANGTLLIQNFQKRRESNETDAGEYDCAAQNRYGMLVSRKARVQLASLPKFHTHPESMSVDEGSVARFHCQVNGIPEASITWERNRTVLSTQDESHEAQLSVAVAAPRIYKEPVILSGPQNLTITVHQTAILECIATGNPRPIVSWSRLDGRSIGVEGIQVLGTGNLMISDVTLQHSGVYVCSANRPGTRMRRTALGRLVVQAPPEFLQWPQSVSKPAGGSAVFTCMAQGVPEPHLIWLKNGKILTPGDNVKLTNNNSTLAVTRITSEDEAIYQCIAENTAGTNQASARLAVSLAKELPEAPQDLSATALSTTALQLSWAQPSPEVTDGIIGYVLHIRMIGEPDSRELQEAVSKTTFQHDFNNLEPATTYSIYLKAYSPLGASQQSNTVFTTTLGGGSLTQNSRGPICCPGQINTHTISHLEPAAVYEIKLLAYNGNGDGDGNMRLVSLAEEGTSAKTSTGGESVCNCKQEGGGSMTGIVVGIHIGMACIIFCVLFLMFGYRRSHQHYCVLLNTPVTQPHKPCLTSCTTQSYGRPVFTSPGKPSLFCRKGTQDSWSVPQGEAAGNVGQRSSPKQGVTRPPEVIELVSQADLGKPCSAVLSPSPTPLKVYTSKDSYLSETRMSEPLQYRLPAKLLVQLSYLNQNPLSFFPRFSTCQCLCPVPATAACIQRVTRVTASTALSRLLSATMPPLSTRLDQACPLPS
ncbi:hypothetical protein SKAU_G00222220 [Synaphobranchus kaupii]|uniref:Immunoglobulin superfamily DCC subclass member 3 n=1 Tax=Synaphobranchus kaupii TaxID=118154 RepID=A0A9Q1FB53_SYNKA|nr:hypothetical protein SKAU_G00222220 [Synaphobranchus kaupii]